MLHMKKMKRKSNTMINMISKKKEKETLIIMREEGEATIVAGIEVATSTIKAEETTKAHTTRISINRVNSHASLFKEAIEEVVPKEVHTVVIINLAVTTKIEEVLKAPSIEIIMRVVLLIMEEEEVTIKEALTRSHTTKLTPIRSNRKNRNHQKP